jgi:hypothetical protein
MYTDEQVEPLPIRDVRCACAVCGAHVIAWEGRELSGWCGVCGSYELRRSPCFEGASLVPVQQGSTAAVCLAATVGGGGWRT